MRSGVRPGQQVTAWSLVAIQLLLLAGLFWTPGSRTWSTPAWLIGIAVLMIAAASLAVMAGAVELGRGLTVSPLPPAAAQLRTTGVYACVRHPIYSGLLLGGAGLVLLSGRLTRVWVWLALLALLWLKVDWRSVRSPPGSPTMARTPPRRRVWFRLRCAVGAGCGRASPDPASRHAVTAVSG
ncbi:MAG TPA: NnrU family protein [Micromonosporaceae bacterium]